MADVLHYFVTSVKRCAVKMPKVKPEFSLPLEMFGLSNYEGRAYVALLKHGPLLASELAYYTGIPRTKSYSIIKSLERKGLVKLMAGKPVRCQALPPEECLHRLLEEEETKLKDMKRTISALRQLRRECAKTKALEEGRYLILSSNMIGSKLKEMVSSAQRSFHCIVDGWGINLLNGSKEAIINISISDVEVKVLMVWNINLEDFSLPTNIDIRVGKHQLGYNVFIADGEGLLLANSSSGFGILIRSRDLCNILDQTLFLTLWERSISLKDAFALMALDGGEDVLNLIVRDEVKGAFAKAVAQAVSGCDNLVKIGCRFIEILEEELNVKVFSKPVEVALPILTTLLLHSLEDGSSVRYDPNTKLLTVESQISSLGGVPESVWMFAIAGLLHKNQMPVTILHNNPQEDLRSLQLRFSHA